MKENHMNHYIDYVAKKGSLEIAKVHNHVPKQVVPKKETLLINMPNRQAGRVRFHFKRNCFCLPSGICRVIF